MAAKTGANGATSGPNQLVNEQDICLGRLAFGSFCAGSGRGHWLEVIGNPRKQVAQLHKLML